MSNEDEVDDPVRFGRVYVWSCNIFPPNYDFEKVCSCDGCRPVIKYLKEFAEGLMSRSKKVLELICQRNHADRRCLCLVGPSYWSGYVLNLFRNNLKAVCEELEVSFTHQENKLEDGYLNLCRVLSHNGLLPSSNHSSQADQQKNTTLSAYDIYAEIGFFGIHHYKYTKVEDEAYSLLKKILEIEDQHHKDKKSAAMIGGKLHPSISKCHIERQIEYLEKLPVDGIFSEVEDLIDKVSHIIPHWVELADAKECIDEVSGNMVAIRRDFWQKYRKNHNDATGHDSTGLKDTLEELLSMAIAFEARWVDYAHLITLYDRSHPQRQRAH